MGLSAAATAWIIRRRLCDRWASLVPLTLIVTLGAAGTLVALGAAHRTGRAYDRYLARAHVGDVLINPTTSTADIDAAIRDLPGARVVTSDAVFLAGLGDGGPLPRDQVMAFTVQVQVRGSTDGRYTSMDLPAPVAGAPTDRDRRGAGQRRAGRGPGHPRRRRAPDRVLEHPGGAGRDRGAPGTPGRRAPDGGGHRNPPR